MSEEMLIFPIATGVFAFLTAIVFGARAKRYHGGYTKSEGHTGAGHD